MRLAVFDLGSTSFQLLVSQAEPDGGLTPILRDRVILNLGAEVAATGEVAPELLERAVIVVRRFRDLAERAEAERLLPVATAAFREAVNQPELARELEGALGAPIRILSGDREARATVAGIRASVALTDPWIALDLGGGSLEIAIVEDGRVRWTETFPLGAARVSRTMVAGDPMTRDERRAIRQTVRDLLTPAIEAARLPAQAMTVAAGGTAGALARLLAADRWPTPLSSLNQFEFTTEDLWNLARTLASADVETRLRMPAIDERRVDLLPAGAITLATTLQLLGSESAIHSEWGLREGVILQEIGADPPASPNELRHDAIARLARRWGVEAPHIEWVRKHALKLFDRTRELHDLSDLERELLDYATTIHDIGVRISPDKHHRHGAYLIEHGGMRGFSPIEVAIMASMIRFHRGSGPKASYPAYAGLTDVERRACRVLTGILRIAHGLGRGGEADVEELGIEVRPKEVVISVAGASNPEGAVAEAEERAAVLAKVLGTRMRFEIVPMGLVASS
jgi:exopolyphosphatase/guanosine-5'-triphosphate,3'-diphosphate pyrophosphatase